MKRKLSALLAIVLAVVMVFPTAVFVGAEEDAVTPMTVKVTGELIKDGKLDLTSVEEGANVSVTMAVGASASFVIKDQPADTELKYNTNGKAAISYDVENKQIVAEKIGSATLTITAEKSGEIKDTIAIAVTVVPKEITKVVLSGTGARINPDDSEVLNGYEQYNAGDVLTITNIYAEYNNGDIVPNVTPSKNNLELTTVNEGKIDDASHVAPNVDLAGDDTVLKFKYIDGENLTWSGAISLNVTTSGIDGIWVDLIDDTPVDPDDKDKLDAGDLLGRICVRIHETEQPDDVFTRYYARHEGSVFALKFFEDTASKTECGFDLEAYFTITVKDWVWSSVNEGKKVKDFFSFYVPTPVGVDINWTNAKTTTYYEGYVIGSEVSDWDGVVVTVTYRNEDRTTYEKTYTDANEIFELNIKLSPVNVRQKFVEIISIDGHTIGKSQNFPAGFELLYREVESIEIDKTTTSGKTSYTEGDALDLSGIKAIIHYNYGDDAKISITNDDYFTTNPKDGDKLTTSDKEVLVVYTDPNTGTKQDTTLPITVTAKAAEKNTVKEVKLLSSASAKREYFIGEAFDPEGFEFLIVYSDATTEVKDLYTYRGSLTIDSNKYSASSKQFTAAMNGDLKVNFNIIHNNTNYKVNLTIPNIVVTKRPVLQSIVADCIKDTYMVGDMPEVQQFTITAKYDDNSTRVFQFADDVTDTEKAKSTFTDTVGGVTYTIKVTPTRIEEDTDAIRVSYSEKVSGVSGTVTKYDDVEIEVVVPDAILSYYDGGWRTKAYMDFDEALDAAEEYADQLTSSYQQSRKPSIQLCKDITVLYDYSVKEYMEIDLNGFDLIMVPGEIFVKSTSTAELTFVNTGDEDSQIIYSKTNEDDNIIIAENDTYTIDADSGDGKYEVTITKPTNGKVTGPDEVTHGHDAKFTITPNEDYEVKTITVKEGKTTKKYDNKDNVVTVKDVQGALTITVTFQEKAWENPFSDVYKSATYYKSIQFVYENGLFSGMSATKFEPDTTMTRAMFVTVLGRLAGIDADEAASRYGTTSSFSDVSATDASISYAVPYIKWATDNGLIEGYGNGKFGPKDNITHIQMYVLMQRYAAFIERLNTSATGTNIPANDVKDIPTWAGAYEAVEYAAKKQFLVTSSNRLTPNGNAKRSELAMLLEKFCTNVLEWDK
ncbi:MAG: S-layer homology domain-containing protein [Clostridia bacterium]|nr:S-layer homology domain-containing protein [Clostridia bacterium]